MKKLELSIPQPCHQNWEAMTPEEKGRFCGACQKTVIDFSRMNDRQIAAFFKKPQDTVCGHFNPTQLNRAIEIERKRIPWVRYFFTISLPAFLFSLKAATQGEGKTRGRVAVTVKPMANQVSQQTPEDKDVKPIKGKIVNENGEPVPFVSIMLEGTSIGTSTDTSGFFQLRHEASEDAVVVLSSVGFQTKKVTVRELSRYEEHVLVLHSALTGEVLVTGYTIVKRSKPIPFLQPQKKEEGFSQFAVYPNPAPSNGVITIEPKNIKAGNYWLQLATSTGIVVQTSEVLIDKKVNRLTTELNGLSSGPYFIRLLNRKNNKAYTEIIVVQ